MNTERVLAGVAVLMLCMAWGWSAWVLAKTRGAGLMVSPGWRWCVDAALVLVTLAIASRWARLGHGPYLTIFEVLLSGIWSLGLIWRLGTLRWGWLLGAGPGVLTVLVCMGLWTLWADPRDSYLPPTYEMTIMWFHIALGKVFLGCALGALGLSMVVLARGVPKARVWFEGLPSDATLDDAAWRMMMVALIFETLMLIAGAVWAQDAWGRFWAWDPLETWAFVTWLLLILALHLRLQWRPSPRWNAWMVVVVFVTAFLTFYGVPFLSQAPHQGAV